MKGDTEMLDHLQRVSKSEVRVPQPVLAEIECGLHRLPRSKRKDRLRRRYVLIRDELARASWDDEVSERYGAIKADLDRRGERIEDLDAAIAAHALAMGAVLVTADRRHMLRIEGLVTESWATRPTG